MVFLLIFFGTCFSICLIGSLVINGSLDLPYFSSSLSLFIDIRGLFLLLSTVSLSLLILCFDTSELIKIVGWFFCKGFTAVLFLFNSMLCLLLIASDGEKHIFGFTLSDGEDIVLSSFFSDFDIFNSGKQFLCSEMKVYTIVYIRLYS